MKEKGQKTMDKGLHIVGITGGIGSGKSYIADGLRQQGYTVYDCDAEAKRIIVEDPQVRAQIIALLGEEAYTPNGTYNNAYVASIVFGQPTLLQQLNAIVHPAVRRDILALYSTLQSHVLFIESAILFESGFDTLCKAVICVTAPEETRIARAMARDHATYEQVQRRIHNQMSEAERQARTSLIVHNDGTIALSTLIQTILQSIHTIIGK